MVAVRHRYLGGSTSQCIGCMDRRIQVQRRDLQPTNTDSAEPVYTYAKVFDAKASISTTFGVREWARISIAGEDITHIITIRYTRTPFDVRDRVRDGAGNLYKIKAIENKNESDDLFFLYCVRLGHESQGAVT